LFLQTVDVKWIARFALGKYWNQASDEQRAKYLEVHKKFLLNGYIPKFREYNNQKIKVTKSSQISEDEYLVETKIISQDGTEVNVSYKVKKHEDAKYIAFDVIAEGVSLITTERADFASVLSRDGIDALITKLGEKR
jgi:phospholipid transport system substrate-binding protein